MSSGVKAGVGGCFRLQHPGHATPYKRPAPHSGFFVDNPDASLWNPYDRGFVRVTQGLRSALHRPYPYDFKTLSKPYLSIGSMEKIYK